MHTDYLLKTEPPESVILDSVNDLTALQESVGGVLSSNDGVNTLIMPFVSKTAQILRHFLRGKDLELSIPDATVLRKLASLDDDRKVNHVLWKIDLLDLKDVPYETRTKFRIIKNSWDLIHYLPLRYIDKSHPQSVRDLILGEWSVIVGTVCEEPALHKRGKKNEYVKIVIQDMRGARLSASFFRQAYMVNKFSEGDRVVLYGTYSEYVNKRGQRFPTITNPKLDKIGTTRGDLPILPVYPQKDGDKSWQLQLAQNDLYSRLVWINDPIPERFLKRHGLLSRNEAYRYIHFPETLEQIKEARRRIAFDEFVRVQILLAKRRDEAQSISSIPKKSHVWADSFIESLPFALTPDQVNVSKEIQEDMSKTKPMYRLLQGEVGSGKSEVASYATLIAAEAGLQTALVAPTDILAKQLHERLIRTFNDAGLGADKVNVVLLVSKMKVSEKRSALEAIKDGTANVIVGTVAVIQNSVEFNNLGLIVIDEQHKFGTHQRNVLLKTTAEKMGVSPDFMMMSATPIPRTVAQVEYGDMDISIIATPPSNRKPVITEWHHTPEVAYGKIREEVEKGHQAYVVASLVADTEGLEDIKSAEATYLDLSNRVFPDLNVGLLHGRLKASEKEQVINSFYEGKIQVLVSTTVVEVGVNVPNATVMTILNANRFGIASLHQIRGRVGRGEYQSYCFLVGEATLPESEERLKALCSSTNGFWLAEKDLEIRGEGKLFGSMQSGVSDMAIANLKEYKDLLELSKKMAQAAKSSKALGKEVEYLFGDKEISV